MGIEYQPLCRGWWLGYKNNLVAATVAAMIEAVTTMGYKYHSRRNLAASAFSLPASAISLVISASTLRVSNFRASIFFILLRVGGLRTVRYPEMNYSPFGAICKHFYKLIKIYFYAAGINLQRQCLQTLASLNTSSRQSGHLTWVGDGEN
jgi:hypothetical protein